MTEYLIRQMKLMRSLGRQASDPPKQGVNNDEMKDTNNEIVPRFNPKPNVEQGEGDQTWKNSRPTGPSVAEIS